MGTQIISVNGDWPAIACSIWNPAAPNSDENSPSDLTLPPFITSMSMSLRTTSRLFGSANNRSITMRRPDGPIVDRHDLRSEQTV